MNLRSVLRPLGLALSTAAGLQACSTAASVSLPVVAGANLRAENVAYVALMPEAYWEKHQEANAHRNEGLELAAGIVAAVHGSNTAPSGGDTSYDDAPIIAGYMLGHMQRLAARHGVPFHDLRGKDAKPEGQGIGISMSKLLVMDDRLMSGDMPVKPAYIATLKIYDLVASKTLHEEELKCTQHQIPDCKAWLGQALAAFVLPDVVDVPFDLLKLETQPGLDAAASSAETGNWADALKRYTEVADAGTSLPAEDGAALQWNLGVARLATGDCAGARTAWTKAGELSADRKEWIDARIERMPLVDDKAKCGSAVTR